MSQPFQKVQKQMGQQLKKQKQQLSISQQLNKKQQKNIHKVRQQLKSLVIQDQQQNNNLSKQQIDLNNKRAERQGLAQSKETQQIISKKQGKEDKEQDEQIPFLLQQKSFPKYAQSNQNYDLMQQQQLQENKNIQQSNNKIHKNDNKMSPQQKLQLQRQKNLMFQYNTQGRQQLIDKKYLQASKNLSKSLMTFEFIMKNHSINMKKQQIKQLMIQHIIPVYNNLALCHLKLGNYSLVVQFTNQVIGQNADNVKARYRRAMAFKMLKKYQEAIEDFNMLAKLDPQMDGECKKMINQCKALQVEQKKRQREAAKKFISGYQSDERKTQTDTNRKDQNMWQPTKIQNQLSQDSDNLADSQENESEGIIKRGKNFFLQWIIQKCTQCTRLFKRRQNPEPI